MAGRAGVSGGRWNIGCVRWGYWRRGCAGSCMVRSEGERGRMGNQLEEGARATLSVALCTWNGEAYLEQQLASIGQQTRRPDELVVCDDGSTDSTLQILKAFQAESPFPVRIFRNDVRLGPTKNFEKAISLCLGEIIALSDQDDVWLSHKLEKLEKTLEDHPEAGYVFSDALVVDEMLRPLGYMMWNRIAFTTRQRRRFEQGYQLEVLLKHNVVTGATMAFRAELRDLLLPIPEQWVHDAWIALLASAAGTGGVLIEESLIHYRQHSKQLIGGLKPGFAEQVRKAYYTKAESYCYEQSKYILAQNRLASARKLKRDVEQLFKTKIMHLQTRQQLHKHSRWRRLYPVFREAISGRYHRFSDGWKSAAKDLFMVV